MSMFRTLVCGALSAIAASTLNAQEEDRPCLNVGRERVVELGKKLYPDLFQVPAPDTAVASYFAILADRLGNPISATRGLVAGKIFIPGDVALEIFPNELKRGRVLCDWMFISRRPLTRGKSGSAPNDMVISFVVVAK
jgi:hypothetical protein